MIRDSKTVFGVRESDQFKCVDESVIGFKGIPQREKVPCGCALAMAKDISSN